MWDDEYSGDPNLATSVGMPPMMDPAAFLPGDIADEQQMSAWNPAPAAQSGQPWWQGIATYGITRAIDNQFPNSPNGLYGNVYAGSGMGAGGRTYSQRPTGAGGGVVGATGRFSLNGNPLGMLLIVGAAFLLLKK